MSKLHVLCLVFIGVLLFACPMAWAESGCFDVSAEISFSGNSQSPFEPYAGDLNVIIGGQLFEHLPATLIVADLKLGDDGTLLFVNIISVDYGDLGTAVLTEHAVASSTDIPYIFHVNSRLNYCVSEELKCTGYFENAFGRLSFHGYADFSTASVAGNTKGRVCW